MSDEPSPPPTPARGRPRGRVIALGLVVLVLGFGVLAEVGARIAWRFEGAIRGSLGATALDEWEEMSPDGRDTWYLKRDLTLTLGDLIDSKILGGRTLAVSELEERLANEPRETVYLRVNRDGFRGPEIDPAHSKPRIIMTGDSVTFGILAPESSPYPRVVEDELAAAGIAVEVVNAGIEGYGADQVLMRADEFLALQPEIVTVLIGWNGIVTAPRPEPAWVRWMDDHLASVRAVRRLPRLLASRAGTSSDWMTSARAATLDDPDLEILKDYRPRPTAAVREFVGRMQREGVEVVLFTLPGLYVMDQPPTERAMSFGFVTPWSNNPYVLARITEIYNEELREVARETGAHLIDLDAWSRDALVPRDAYFFDSVHLTDPGLRLMGQEIARQMAPIVATLDRR
ncbi:MAG: hypothetical protein AMXMBFR23_04730 [Chloroflexota bacterium]